MSGPAQNGLTSANLKQDGDTLSASVLLSSHILSEVEQLCDYVTVLKEGRAVASIEVSCPA